MASAVAIPQANGIASLLDRESSAPPNHLPVKRKREEEEVGEDGDSRPASAPRPNDESMDMDMDVPEQPAVSAPEGESAAHMRKGLVRDFFHALQNFDPDNVITKRPLPTSSLDAEPDAKRPRSSSGSAPLTIQEKVQQDVYQRLEDLFNDIISAAETEVAALQSADSKPGRSEDNSETISKAVMFRNKACELFRREVMYPSIDRPPSQMDSRHEIAPKEPGGAVLMAYGLAPTLKPVFSSTQKPAGPTRAMKPLSDADLPMGLTVSRVMKTSVSTMDKNHRTMTLGELFPSPRNPTPLLPPKPPKGSTKGKLLTFYHPELSERTNEDHYAFKKLNAGRWLDYSNATPALHPKLKQHKRTASLSGSKLSSDDAQATEFDALFRGAFSSFAPCKDDSSAVVSSAQVSRLWWHRSGRRRFERMCLSQVPQEADVDMTEEPAFEVDEDAVEEALRTWDDGLIDPSLDRALGKKSTEEKDVDDLLEEISDLLETLASHQRNRNLKLPWSHERLGNGSTNGDMLRNGGNVAQPSEEEMATYEALKAQLTLIINQLPPFAVARLNSDRLAELSVSTRIEIRTDEFRGVMEEDEPMRLQRQVQQASANAAHRSSSQQRTGSSIGPGGYGTHHAHSHHHSQPPLQPQTPSQQYYGHAQQPGSRTTVPQQQYQAQTPARTPMPNYHSRPPSSAIPLPQQYQQQAHQTPQRALPPVGAATAPQIRMSNHHGPFAPSPQPSQPSHMAMQPASYGQPSPMQLPVSPARAPAVPYSGYNNGTTSGGFPKQYPQYPQGQPMPPLAAPPTHSPYGQHTPQHAQHAAQPQPQQQQQQQQQQHPPAPPAAHHQASKLQSQPQQYPQHVAPAFTGQRASPGLPPQQHHYHPKPHGAHPGGHHSQAQQQAPAHGYGQFQNGAHLQRTMSSPQMAPAHGYNQSATPPHQASPHLLQQGQGHAPPHPHPQQQRPQSPHVGSSHPSFVSPATHQFNGLPGPGGVSSRGPGPTSYVSDSPQQQLANAQQAAQANARIRAQQTAMGKSAHGEILGLPAISLGVAAQRNMQTSMGGAMSPSPANGSVVPPRPPSHSPDSVHGSPAM